MALIGRRDPSRCSASHHGHRRARDDRDDDGADHGDDRHGRRRSRRRRSDGGREGGASLVEFAFVAPFLVTLLFGVIDYGMVLSNTIGLRQGVREAGRQASVADYGPAGTCSLTGAGSASADMRKLMCLTKARSDVSAGSMRVAVRLQTAASTPAVGDAVVLCSITPMSSLTGFFDPLMDGRFVRSKVVMRIEKVDTTKPLTAVHETAPAGQSWSWCTA